MKKRKKMTILEFGTMNLRDKKSRGYGRSKHRAKQKNNGKTDPTMIHTSETYKKYKGITILFCRFLDSMHYSRTDFSGLKEKVQMFLKSLQAQKYSPCTICSYASALKKAYDLHNVKFDLPSCSRENITKVRELVLEDGYWEEQSIAIILARCTGLRRRKELAVLRSDDCFTRFSGKRLSFRVRQGKGGKARYVDVFGSEEELSAILALVKERKDQTLLLAKELPRQTMTYRAEYALRVYFRFARPIDSLKHKEKYFCRSDMKGFVFDRAAMLHASRALGHNRLNVIAKSYLWPEMLRHFVDSPEGCLFSMPEA